VDHRKRKSLLDNFRRENWAVQPMSGQAFEQQCADYVRREARDIGGFREAWAGFRLRTFPYMLGRETRFSASSVAFLLLKVGLLVITALVPVAARKLAPAQPTPAASSSSGNGLWDVLTRFDTTDWVLISIVVGVTLAGKATDKWASARKGGSGDQEFAGVLELLPLSTQEGPPSAFTMSTEHCKAIQACLTGIRYEIGKLLLDDTASVITDVVYLQFTAPDAKYLHVRTRIHEDKSARPFEARLAQAYYVAQLGECMAENDLHAEKNPFETHRISVPGRPKATYRSILFVPIITSEADAQGVPVDYCVGVICVHSPKPFRFWRFGDHKRKSSSFCNVAYKAIEPYSRIIRRLSSPTPNRLKVTP